MVKSADLPTHLLRSDAVSRAAMGIIFNPQMCIADTIVRSAHVQDDPRGTVTEPFGRRKTCKDSVFETSSTQQRDNLQAEEIGTYVDTGISLHAIQRLNVSIVTCSLSPCCSLLTKKPSAVTPPSDKGHPSNWSQPLYFGGERQDTESLRCGQPPTSLLAILHQEKILKGLN
ncbi:hypothetical protein CDAR_579431 [Caerostris darwini]|uniref:Uncharacterized protein n=1 Tax=Caerostris darwini TaxID=1538125 RepID=A0AAV4V324_9ARAC|nr:hypothetical protein CDAR_579431 [Caerostris darwini]